MPSSLCASADLQKRILQVYAALLALAKVCPQTDSRVLHILIRLHVICCISGLCIQFQASSHKRHKTKHIALFFFPHPPLSSSPDAEINIQTVRDKHCVRCFAVIFHGGIFYRCRFVGARLVASSPVNRRLIPHMSALPVSTCPQITAIHHCWTRRYTPLRKEFLVCVEAVNRGRCREGREARER